MEEDSLLTSPFLFTKPFDKPQMYPMVKCISSQLGSSLPPETVSRDSFGCYNQRGRDGVHYWHAVGGGQGYY